MIFGVAPVSCAERFAALRDVLLYGHVRVPKHDGLCLAALGGQNLELLAAVAGFAFLDTTGFVYLHVFATQ